MKHMVLILASGDQDGWVCEEHPIVFLAPIAGESLIARVVRQVMERDLVPIVVTHIPEVARAAYPGLVLFLEKTLPRYVDTVMATDHLWADRGDSVLGRYWGVEKLTVLHGDAVWDDGALDFVLDYNRSAPMFFGGVTGAVAAWGVGAEGFLEIVHACENVVERWPSRLYFQFGTKDNTENPYHSKIPSGFSTDFDGIAWYESWLSSRPWAQ